MHLIKQLNRSGFFSIKLNIQRHAKINDKNRRFGVFMTPLSIKHELVNCSTDDDSKIIVGGDFNVVHVLDSNLDGQGGKLTPKESAKHIEDICSSLDLVDIWRVRNPGTKRFSWRQKTLFIQRRLDYWLADNALQEEIDQVDIIPSIKSDHSAILLTIKGIDNESRGPSFSKFNASLLDDKEYVDMINHRYQEWIKEFNDVQDAIDCSGIF